MTDKDKENARISINFLEMSFTESNITIQLNIQVSSMKFLHHILFLSDKIPHKKLTHFLFFSHDLINTAGPKYRLLFTGH